MFAHAAHSAANLLNRCEHRLVEQAAWRRREACLNYISPVLPGTKPDPLWSHGAHVWLVVMAPQLARMVVFIALAWSRLASAGPPRRRQLSPAWRDPSYSGA